MRTITETKKRFVIDIFVFDFFFYPHQTRIIFREYISIRSFNHIYIKNTQN